MPAVNALFPSTNHSNIHLLNTQSETLTEKQPEKPEIKAIPFETLCKQTIPSLTKLLDSALKDAQIEFGENGLSPMLGSNPDKTLEEMKIRWIEASAVRGSNEGNYIHLRLISPRGSEEDSLVASGKTWGAKSAAEIVYALTILLSDY